MVDNVLEVDVAFLALVLFDRERSLVVVDGVDSVLPPVIPVNIKDAQLKSIHENDPKTYSGK